MFLLLYEPLLAGLFPGWSRIACQTRRKPGKEKCEHRSALESEQGRHRAGRGRREVEVARVPSGAANVTKPRVARQRRLPGGSACLVSPPRGIFRMRCATPAPSSNHRQPQSHHHHPSAGQIAWARITRAREYSNSRNDSNHAAHRSAMAVGGRGTVSLAPFLFRRTTIIT